jgi:uncharacterized protein
MLPIITLEGKVPYPPRVSEFTQEFWEPLKGGVLRTTRCRKCEKQTFPPKIVCPHCWSDSMQWTELTGEGQLYSWTKIHAAPTVFQHESPYMVGIVDLDSGVRIACRLISHSSHDPKIGDRIEMVVFRYENGSLFGARTRDIH